MTEPMTPVPPRSGDDTYDLIDGALYQLAERRGRWPGDPVAAAMIDRLVHHAEVVNLKGDSYRLKNRDLGRVPTDDAA